MPINVPSPLTENEVSRTTFSNDTDRYDDICGPWSITDEAEDYLDELRKGFCTLGNRKFRDRECRQIIDLARSTVWRSNNLDRKNPLFMTLSGAQSKRSSNSNPRLEIFSFEELCDEAIQMSLETKALFTLENLTVAETKIGAGVEVPYHLRNYPGKPAWKEGQPPKETGITYCATDTEAAVVYHYLINANWIVAAEKEHMGELMTRLFITPEGYAKVAELKSGRSGGAIQAFFVCRFISQIDALYDSTIMPLGTALKCPIKRIKDIHHVDKIDDRLCLEISRSKIVIVDLTEQNFNVAFEAGYALALNKPIVWTKRKEPEGPKMPFDIYTYNCLEWEPDQLEKFRDELKYRIISALEKAGVGGRG